MRIIESGSGFFMHNSRLRYIFFLLFLLIWADIAGGKVMPVEFDAGRNRLIAYILGKQLPAQHFSHKAMDDDLSRAAFDLYLKQLDPGKRFLLKEDVRLLQAYAAEIDDELQRGHIVLPDRGAAVLEKRIRQVRDMVGEIMEAGFDVNREDYLEIDPKKRDFLATPEELRQRWRRILQMQTLTEYFILLEEKEGEKEKGGFFQNLLSELEKPVNVPEGRAPLHTAIWQEAKEKIKKRYDSFFQRLLQETRQDYYNRYFNSVARAFDPHTSYMPPTSKEDFDIHMRGTLEGIGALLREEDGYIKVVRIIPGSAAEKQGELQAEDIILAVGEDEGEPVDITHMRIREAVGYIRGPKGTVVRLTIRRAGAGKKVIAITRDVVKIEDTYVKSAVLDGGEAGPIGYIKIPSFYRDFAGDRNGSDSRNVSDDVRRVLREMKDRKLGGMIVDLRNNGGGSLADAVEVSGLFIAEGPIVQVKSSQGMIRVLRDEDEQVRYDGPLIVLVNKFSASASEIMAAALQDYGRALIMGGEHTHGKGTVQAILDLNRNMPFLHLKKYEDLGALKVTIQKFYRISGDSTQEKGVEPDISLPDVLGYLQSGEKYLDYALPWDRVQAVDHVPWKRKYFDIEAARRVAIMDVDASPEFAEIRREVELARKREENTRLNISYNAILLRRQESEAGREQEKDGYSSPHGGIRGHGTGIDPDEPADKAAEKGGENMEKELAEDPYVQEALHIFTATGRPQKVADRAE